MSELQVIITVFLTALTTLGIPKLVEAWQNSRIKVTEAETTHKLEQDSLAVQYIIDQAEHNRKQVEDLQNNKFVQIRDDFNAVKHEIVGLRADLKSLESKITPCESLFDELHVNREKTLQQYTNTHQVLRDIFKMFDVLGKKMGIEMRRFDSTGMLSDVMEAAFSGEDTSTTMRIKGRTGQFPLASQTQDNQE